jgi:hypothetical protein
MSGGFVTMTSRNFIWYWNVVHYCVYRFVKNQSFTNPSIHAGSFMILLVGIIDWAIFNVCQIFFQTPLSDWIFKKDTNDILFLVFLTAPAILFNYFILFRHDKYLKYFSELDKINSDEKSKNTWVSIVTVIFIVAMFIVSFKYVK